MIVDTGVFIAAVDRDDHHHDDARAILGGRLPLVVPEPVVGEAAWVISKILGVGTEVAFIRGLDEGLLFIEPMTSVDRSRAAELIERYADARIGYVDAAVVAVAERLSEVQIATVDHRDFSMIRPRHVEAFELLPQIISK